MCFMVDKRIENKTCTQCSCNFTITEKDLDFYQKVSPQFSGEIFSIPSPTLCPGCREQRRLSFRNERTLYRRQCDKTNNWIISIYSPDKQFKIYNHDFYWSDNWDALDYWRKYTDEKAFFKQFQKLNLSVPKRAVMKGSHSENCDYVNFVWESKDCYLMFNAANNEGCSYSNGIIDCFFCMDSSLIRKSRDCYQCIDVENCHNCFFLQDCLNCSNSEYLYNCKNCNYCTSCVNIDNKSYCIENEQYTRDEYFKELKRRGINYNDFKNFKLRFPMKFLDIINSEGSYWNIIYNSNNVQNSFEVYDSENIKYSSNIFRDVKDSMDVYVAINNCSLLYESHIINKHSSNILFSSDCWWNCSNLVYCIDTKNSQYCFWCAWLNSKQYCILNKQYTKEEYERLVPKIIKQMQQDWEWWEFFPSNLSPFWYNETVASEYFPLTEVEALEKWFNWSDYQAPFPKVEKIILASKLPEIIRDIPDDILNWAIECEVTQKPFKIIKQELDFYRKHNLPIPKRHPDQRHLDRMELRNPRKLFERDCDKCWISMQTTYAPERPEIVYCEECFNKENY